MKSVFLVCLMSALVMSLVISSCTAPATPAPSTPTPTTPMPTPTPTPTPTPPKTITLKATFHQPATHPAIISANEIFPVVEELTEGRVKIDIYDSQTLVKAPETFDAINRGIADISAIPLALFQSGLPWWGVEFLPGVIKDFQGAHDAAKNGMLDIYQEAFNSKGMNIRIASLYCPTMCCIMTKDKRVAVPEDLKGLKIQCAGAGEASVIEALGGVPVVMPHAEAYEAIMRGMVDGTHFGIAGFAYKLQEPCDYLCTYSLGGAYVAALVSESSLAEMSATDQGIVLEVVRHYALQDELNYAMGQERIFEKYYKPYLKEVVSPTPEQVRKWEETLAPMIDEWLAKAGPEGGKALDILRQYNP